MTLPIRSVMLKSLLAIGVTVTLAGCVSDGYGDPQGVGVGIYATGVNGPAMHRHWNRHSHGNRCRVAFGTCSHFYRGYFYETPWWSQPY